MRESTVVGLFTFFLGLLLGHQMTLWRERRKEFNQVASRIRVALKERRKNPSPYFSSGEKIEGIDLEVFEHLLSAWQRMRFQRIWSEYNAERKRTIQDAAGQAFYERPAEITAALEKLIPFTRLR